VKKILALVVLICFSACLLGCGNTKMVGGVEYDTYGLINKDAKENPNIQYEVIWGNVFWGVVLSETLIAPVYFFGYSLFEPVGPRSSIKGQVVK
jgi:hypothetical protein